MPGRNSRSGFNGGLPPSAHRLEHLRGRRRRCLRQLPRHNIKNQRFAADGYGAGGAPDAESSSPYAGVFHALSELVVKEQYAEVIHLAEDFDITVSPTVSWGMFRGTQILMEKY